MAPALTYRRLHAGLLSTVVHVRCREGKGGCGCEECTSAHSIVFVRRGTFAVHFGRERHVCGPNEVVFLPRGRAFRVSHPASGGDDCLSILLQPDTLRELVSPHDPRAGEREHDPFPAVTSVGSASTHLAQARLTAALSRGICDELEREERALGIAASALGSAFAQRPPPRARRRGSTDRAHRDLAQNVKEALSVDPARRWTLPTLARAVHSSPAHLCRVFRERTGASVHGYLSDVRLRTALERLAGGERDTTRLALDLGYSSRGHFTDAFAARFGVRPSAFRRLTSDW